MVNKPKDGLSASWGRGKKTVKDLEQEKRCTTERYTGAALLEMLRRQVWCTREAPLYPRGAREVQGRHSP